MLLSTCRNGKSQIQQVNDCGDTRWVNYGTACTATNDVKYKPGCACDTYVKAGEVTGYGSTTSAAKDDANAKAQAQADSMACNTVYQNENVSLPFTRDNCGSGCTGTTVNAPISAGQSQFNSCESTTDANNKAKAYLNAGAGQAYANQHGSCNCPQWWAAGSGRYEAFRTIGYTVTYENPCSSSKSATIVAYYTEGTSGNEQSASASITIPTGSGEFEGSIRVDTSGLSAQSQITVYIDPEGGNC